MNKVDFTLVLLAILFTSIIWFPILIAVSEGNYVDGYKVGYAEGRVGLPHQYKPNSQQGATP